MAKGKKFERNLNVWKYLASQNEAAVRDTGNTSILPESSSICNTGTDTGKY